MLFIGNGGVLTCTAIVPTITNVLNYFAWFVGREMHLPYGILLHVALLLYSKNIENACLHAITRKSGFTIYSNSINNIS